MALKIGDKAPDFEVNDQDGVPVKLSDLRGQKVVLYFYPKDMTPGCTAESCNLRDNYERLQDKGYEVLGISSDDEQSHRKFIEQENLPFRLLADTDRKVHDAYGTWVEKQMYGRTYMGTARVTFIIDEDGVIEDVIDKVDTENHTSQILKGIASNGEAHDKTDSIPATPTPAPVPVPAKKVAAKKVTKKAPVKAPAAAKKAAPKKAARKTAKKAAKKVAKKAAPKKAVKKVVKTAPKKVAKAAKAVKKSAKKVAKAPKKAKKKAR
ncbi:thioredoxin-dependent thiol peroxidase [Dawidia soli]|uniref:thioredoxin-dependent peroxiredoxin n=1 Tax=Dawidia soli TaxID=2782352 RepID=A0AAP2GI01_9BACT|nr:thioredoxin-dependent thiol peroxidase [Dawidia soli]MBT1686528.1 thioredoxin-dependent thiol peroxidase [Dawidia soli]